MTCRWCDLPIRWDEYGCVWVHVPGGTSPMACNPEGRYETNAIPLPPSPEQGESQ